MRAVAFALALAWMPPTVGGADPVPIPPEASVDASGQDGLEIPWTRDKILWRTEFGGRRGARIDRVKGSLTLDESTLRIETRKGTVEIPLDQIQLVFPTTLGKDVDLQWVAVQVRERVAGRPRIYGLRDARKLGFGGDTPKIAEALIARLELLGVAQFRSEGGYNPYTALDERMVFLVPNDWRVDVLAEVYEGGLLTSGHTRFLAPDREDVSLEMSVQAAPRGYRCKQLPISRLETQTGGAVEVVEIAHCSGARIVLPPSAGGESVTRWQVANGASLFELTLRSPAAERSRWLELAERVVESWRLAVQP